MLRQGRTLRAFTWVAVLSGCAAQNDAGTRLDESPVGAGQNAPETGGAGGASGASNAPSDDDGPDLCEIISLRADPIAPDMLIVLDRSLSMVNSGALGVSRWPASVAAIERVTAQLDDAVRFGLMVFPGSISDDVCEPGEVKVEIAEGTGEAIAQVLDATSPSGTTPTALSLARAGQALRYDESSPDSVLRSKYVLLVTDGAPTCRMDASFTNGPDQDNTYAAISALADDDIKTYVVGYDTRGSQFESQLDEMARRGNTGDAAHRPVEDEASLVDELESIAASAISCSYALDRPPGDPTYVRVQIDGVTYPLGSAWELSGDQTVSLLEPACDVLRDGRSHSLDITVECERVVVL